VSGTVQRHPLPGVIPYFDDAEIRAALKWSDLIVAMERALAALSTGKVLQPVRTWLTLEERRASAISASCRWPHPRSWASSW
jgi:hypothetical protein